MGDMTRLADALERLASSVGEEGTIAEACYDIRRIADALEQIAECVGETSYPTGVHFLRTLDCGRD